MLGIEPETLRTDAAPLLDLIILEDRARFEDSVKLSACAFDLWRWEGRVRAKGGDPI
jgi:PAS domain-containing protein